MNVAKPWFKMKTSIFFCFFFCCQIHIFIILMDFMIISSLAFCIMERPSCSSQAQDFVSYIILLVNLKNKSSCDINNFANKVCLKPWNFLLDFRSHLNHLNPSWAPSNLSLPHYNVPLLTFHVHLVTSSLLLAFLKNLLQTYDNFLCLGNNFVFCFSDLFIVSCTP